MKISFICIYAILFLAVTFSKFSYADESFTLYKVSCIREANLFLMQPVTFLDSYHKNIEKWKKDYNLSWLGEVSECQLPLGKIKLEFTPIGFHKGACGAGRGSKMNLWIDNQKLFDDVGFDECFPPSVESFQIDLSDYRMNAGWKNRNIHLQLCSKLVNTPYSLVGVGCRNEYFLKEGTVIDTKLLTKWFSIES